MAVNLSLLAGAGWQFFNSNGDPLSGGKLYTYAAGTTTPQITYTSNSGSIPNANPIILNAAGRLSGSGEIWLTEGINYKFVLTDSNDVLIGTYDNISGANDGTAIYNALANTSDPAKGDALVGFRQSDSAGNLPSAVGRTVHQKLQEYVSVKDFGAVGDAITDDRAAIIAADAYAASSSRTLYFPTGVYMCSDGIQQTAPQWIGAGAPVMGTFPTIQDDKRFLRPGYKHLIPGTALLFSGTGTQTGTTVRAAPFNSFTYCVKAGSNTSSPLSMSNIGIVMDMDVLTANGVPTNIYNDNRANYQVGLFLDDVTRGFFNNVVVFGYFSVAGVVHYGSDPDDTSFTEGSSSGNIGFAILGDGTNGLSGTQFYSWSFFANDHHSRQFQWGENCLYIDGSGVSINGHYFFGGRVQSYVNVPVRLAACNNVVFSGTVFELPDLPNPETLTSLITATSNTGDVAFMNCRWTDNPIFGADRLTGQSGGYVYLINPPTYKGIEAWYDNKGVRIRPQPDGSGGTDSTIQLTDNADGSNTGWSIRRDDSASNLLDFRYNNASVATLNTAGDFTPLTNLTRKQVFQVSTLTIQSGEITVLRSWHRLAAEGSPAADDLVTVNGGEIGQFLVLSSNTSGDVITLKDGSGNLRLAGDFTLTNGQDRIVLLYDGTNWCELSRSDNTV